MALVTIEVPVDRAKPVPPRVQALLDDAARRVDDFIEQHKDSPILGFVPSDYEQVWRTLHALRTSVAGGFALPGNAFCEWGSGLGVIACLAAQAGFDSVGIEINAELVEWSRELASDHGLNVEMICGSYVPEDHEVETEVGGESVMTLEPGLAAYEELGLEVDDFDCIFAYPWPGEDDVVTGIFDAHAARGAVLVSFHGQDGMLVRRKIK